MRLEEFASRAGAQLVDVNGDAAFYSFALDSREAIPGSLFLAIKGARVDGHDYVYAALDQGAVACVVEHRIDGPHIRIDNLVDALARFASSIRDEFEGPVIGVTGSAGKTTTKEFCAAALRPLGRVIKTEGNRNTEYTAPLLWADREGDEKAAVVEMSMRGFGQIAHLASFSKPTVGIITNIGFNHLEKVGSQAGIAKAKGELLQALPSNGLAILWAEDAFLDTLRSMAPCPVKTFGFSSESDAQVLDYRPVSWNESIFKLRVGGESVAVRIPYAGRHFALNAASAILAAIACGVSLHDAAQAVATVKLPAMRMEPVVVDGVTYVMDSYNAAPQSFAAALETLAELPTSGKRIVVAGEMKELGDMHEEGHRMVGRAIAKAKPDHVVFYGEAMMWAREEAIKGGLSELEMQMADSLETVTMAVGTLASEGDTVLVKGSRAMELEKAIEPLLKSEEVEA